MELATFGAGCFWGVEERFRKIDGVVSTVVGYEGGTTENPTYEQVCSKTTGHAEVVQLEFDPEQVSYEELVRIFFDQHDPTQLNRQGPDIGDQYRSVIFFHDANQQSIAESILKELDEQGIYPQKIVTKIEPAQPFYKAEEYHQKYVMKTGRNVC